MKKIEVDIHHFIHFEPEEDPVLLAKLKDLRSKLKAKGIELEEALDTIEKTTI